VSIGSGSAGTAISSMIVSVIISAVVGVAMTMPDVRAIAGRDAAATVVLRWTIFGSAACAAESVSASASNKRHAAKGMSRLQNIFEKIFLTFICLPISVV